VSSSFRWALLECFFIWCAPPLKTGVFALSGEGRGDVIARPRVALAA
jgi:hypothetical protein